ncbi:ribosome biogenesis GTPase Der [Candidatus Portiera aleyrodidarum]|uniref:GTPase Der n=1 Tax=Candidatus Portiera aleyrodidarum TaxID=91844 RepID=A0A6S6S5Z3_9GAMM|nr:ribosome biogenesis GTPase Der [Candidatus Portiera aleyrodidarum]CAA3707163.1 GTPase Der [Candidatus Portiera aleyrodidarum]
MNQIISIIGKTNVGKSTLFNCLTKTKYSITNNIPFFTRDRKYGFLQINNNKFTLIDTAAISNNFFYYKEKNITYYINKQTKIAIQESHIILFLITSYTQLDSFYKKFIKFLQQKNKTIIFIINKIDYIINFSFKKFFNFYKPIFISALHKINIKQLLNNIKVHLSKNKNHIHNNNYEYTKICLIGKTNVGKSTLINSLLKETRLIINHRPGTTRENITIKLLYKNHLFILTDTKGITQNIKQHKFLFNFIQHHDIIFFIIDATMGFFEQDIFLLKKIFFLGKHLFLIINKCDAINNKQKLFLKQTLHLKLYQYIKFLTIHFISALYFYNLKTLFNSIDFFLYLKSKSWSIHFLTKLINLAIKKKPLFKKKHILKFLLAKQININPIIIIIFGQKQINFLPNHYKKYLFNFLVQNLNIKNIFLQLHFFNN